MTTAQNTTIVHRYTCTIHDGEPCDGHCTTTPEQLTHRYADAIATITGKTPATTLADFTDQLDTAGLRLEDAGIQGAEDLVTAAIYLTDLDEAAEASGIASDVLLSRARGFLASVPAMVDEYRDMVDD